MNATEGRKALVGSLTSQARLQARNLWLDDGSRAPGDTKQEGRGTMTLIVGIEKKARVTMGADSACGWREEVFTDPHGAKIALCGGGRYLIGSCGSARVAQVLQHLTEWPEPPPSGDLLPFLIREVAPEVLRSVKAASAAYAEPNDGLHLGKNTVVLIGVRGELYSLSSDLTVMRQSSACIGFGRTAGNPVMEALEKAGIEPARKRVEMTLEIVARHTPLVAPPFRILELPPAESVLSPRARPSHSTMPPVGASIP